MSAAFNRSLTPAAASLSARPFSQSMVRASQGNQPTRAPHSVVMLLMLMRASTERPATPGPPNSTAAFRTSPLL